MIKRKKHEIFFNASTISQIADFLEQNTDINLTELTDEKNNTVLHTTAFQNSLNLMKLYVSYIAKYFQTENSKQKQSNRKNIQLLIQNWTNMGNIQGFTAIHYACYKGNLQMVHFLQSLGANLYIITKNGLNSVHLAAQGDRLNIMFYLYDKFDSNCKNNQKETPLHCACYTGSQNIANFLLAQPNLDIDALDQQQQTPLHLATLYGNTKIVKRLLIKGANRNLRNRKEQLPIQIAKANDFRNITKLLKEKFTILEKIRFFFNLKNVYKPTERSLFKPCILLFVMLLITLTTHILIQPNFNQLYLIIPLIYYVVYFANYASLMTFTHVMRSNKPYISLINEIPICPQCKIRKIARSQHCDTCKICIRMYDHHCFWINNCVGRHNLVRFIIFVIMTLIGLVETALISIEALLNGNIYFKKYRFSSNNTFYSIIMIINIGIFLFLIGPMIMLLYVQLTNLLMNETTYERYSKTKYIYMDTIQQRKKKQGEKFKSPKIKKSQKYSINNCMIMCSLPEEDVQQRLISQVEDQIESSA